MRPPLIVTDDELWRLAGALAALVVTIVAVAFTLGGVVTFCMLYFLSP